MAAEHVPGINFRAILAPGRGNMRQCRERRVSGDESCQDKVEGLRSLICRRAGKNDETFQKIMRRHHVTLHWAIGMKGNRGQLVA